MKPFRFPVPTVDTGRPLVDFLAARLNSTKRHAKELLNARRVFVNRQRVWMARHELQGGDCVEIQPESAPAKRHEARPGGAPSLLYQDADYIAFDKPPGLLSNGPDSAESLLRSRLRQPGLLAVHRLDRDTSGCLLLARTREAFDAMIPVFRKHEIRKQYHAIVVGCVTIKERTISFPVDGEHAVTTLKTLDSSREASHLLLTIDTGRTHQIRRHLEGIHHPVVGDRHYGTRFAVTDNALAAGRQMLHAASIEFQQPLNKRRIVVRAPLPSDFRSALRRFGLT